MLGIRQFIVLGALLPMLCVAPPAVAQTIPERIEQLLTDPDVAGNDWSILIENDEGTIEYYSRAPDNLLAPASNTKMFTTAAAFGLLGPAYSFETRVYRDGTLSGGTLTGNLNLVSEHDITWNSSTLGNSRAALDRIADRLFNLGLRTVTGNVQCYGACFYDFGQFDDVRSSSNRQSYNASAASAFRSALIARGIAVQGGSAGQLGFSPPGTLMLTHRSSDLTRSGQPLTLEIACIPLNQVSHNAMADALLFHLGWKLRGSDSLSAGAAEVVAWLASDVGLATAGIDVNDGSGLSRSNRFSARQTIQLTRHMLNNFPTWDDTLAIGCQAGTIGGRFCTSEGIGRVHAKTGTLGISIALSGYIDNVHDDERYLFSFIANRSPSINSGGTRSIIDQAVLIFGERGVPLGPDLQFVRNDGTGDSVTLRWNDPGFALTGFNIYRSENGENFGPPVSLQAVPEYVIETRAGGRNLGDYSEIGEFYDSSSHSTAPGTTPPGEGGIGSRFALPGPGGFDTNGRNDRARFTPDVPTGGYTVDVTCFDFSSANAQNITVRINDALGVRTSTIDLTAASCGDVWTGVGTMQVVQGAGHFVEFDNSTQSNFGDNTDSRMNAAAVRLTSTTALDFQFTDTGLATLSRGYYRVSATTQLGESKLSDTYSVRVGGSPAPILIVDGNDRWRYQTSENPGAGAHLFAARAGDAITGLRTFDTASNEAVAQGLVPLGDYGAVIWLLGEESTVDETFSGAEQPLVAAYLNGGGNLFFSGAEVGWDLGRSGVSSAADVAFYENTLRHRYVADDANVFAASPVAGRLFDGAGAIDFSGGEMFIGFPDVVQPVNGSQAVLRYSASEDAALSYSGTYKVVGFGFPFESIGSAATRTDVMNRILDFFLGDEEFSAGIFLR